MGSMFGDWGTLWKYMCAVFILFCSNYVSSAPNKINKLNPWGDGLTGDDEHTAPVVPVVPVVPVAPVTPEVPVVQPLLNE